MSGVSPLHVQPLASPSEGAQASLQRHLQRVRVLRPGLHLHADDTADAQDFTASGEMDAGLRIVLLLEGSVDVSYGPRRVALSSSAAAPRARAPGAPRALLVSVAQPERFERRGRRGTYARRVSVGLGGEWLEQVAGPWRRMQSMPFAVSTWPCTTGSLQPALPPWPSRSPAPPT